MRIGINLLFLLPNSVGGTETYARGILEGLKQIDKKNNYLVFCNKEGYKTFKSSKNIKIICLPISGKNRFLRLLFELFLFPYYIAKYNVDLLHSLGYSTPFFLNCPSLVMIYDLNWYFHPEDFSFLKRIGWRFVVRNSAKFSTKIITSSNSSKESLINIFKIHYHKIEVVYGGLPKMKKTYPKNKLMKLGIRNKYIFTVTSTYPHKNLITLLKSFNFLIKHKNVSFQLVVAGLAGRAHEEIIKYIRNNNLNNKVLLLGWVDDRTLATLYKFAELMVFPSLYEGFGFPVLEAMGYGAPVISSSSYSLKEVVGQAGILINPKDIQQLADKIDEVFSNKKMKDSLSKKGILRSKLFNWTLSAKKTLGIYYKIGYDGQ